jgi:hypothetical protein
LTSLLAIPACGSIPEPKLNSIGRGPRDFGDCLPRYIQGCAALSVFELDTGVSFSPYVMKMGGLQTADRSTFSDLVMAMQG